MQCVQQLNDYLKLLPCLYQSNQATKTMKKVGPINDADLVGNILCMCPRTWQAQYKLKADTVPQGVHDLLDDLEQLKKAFSDGARTAQKEGEGKPQ